MAFRLEIKPSKSVFELLGVDETSFSFKKHILDKYQSIESLQGKAAEAGNWEAKEDLSLVYENGIPELNIEKDMEKALGWLQSSVDSGNQYTASAFLRLGTLYDLTDTITGQTKAHKLYHEAALRGSLQACLNLAESYKCGIDDVVNEDINEAITWYKIAAGEESLNVGNNLTPLEQVMIGSIKKMDHDVQIQALKRLHTMYINGECPEGTQPVKAIYYIKKAAERGDVESQTKLGLIYLTGENGLPKDLEKAKRWLEKAAQNESSEAKEVLQKLNQQGIIELSNPNNSQDEQCSETFKQIFQLYEEKMQKNYSQHPFAVENPLTYTENMFTAHPDSPTAQHYLKSFKYAEKGLHKLESGHFKEAIKLFAYSFLYENTILSFLPQKRLFPEFSDILIEKILQQLKSDEYFFEGLVILYVLQPILSDNNEGKYKYNEQCQRFLKNLISLIKKHEPLAKFPNDDPYNFESNYSSWLHVLYYFLGSNYTISSMYDDGAQAFEMALKQCPKYFEAKDGLGYCLMLLSSADPNSLISKTDRKAFKYLRISETSFLTMERKELVKKAKMMFKEYLQEAPECDKKYPNCHYHLADLYMLEDNFKEANKWKAKGEDAEEKRLPFMPPVDFEVKEHLSLMDILPTPIMKQCSNEDCTNESVDEQQLKSCPCKKVSYCGRKCQKKDWANHKKTCSTKCKEK